MPAGDLHHLMEEDARSDGTAWSGADEKLFGGLHGEARRAKQPSRRAIIVGTVSSMVLLSAGIATLAWRSPAPAGATEGVALSLEETKSMECAIAGIQDCSTSRCCQDFGFTCFAKNATWAGCLDKCDRGTLLRHGNGSWSCKALGDRTRCASATENCNLLGCCADIGHQCFAKNKNWGSCMKTCNPVEMKAWDPKTQDWSCDPIGPRNTMDYRNDYSHGMVEVEPWVKNCSHIGDNCASTKCCSFSGYKCYEKDATWSSCLQKCFPGKWNGGIVEKPMIQKGKPINNPPSHFNATFTPAQPGPWTCKRLSVPMKPGYLAGTSLYCYTVALSDNGSGKKIHDLDIMKKAQEKLTHVFACDHWTVFSDQEVSLNPGKTVKVYFPHVLHRPNTKSWVNLPFFLTVWQIMRQATTWKSFPWIVKSDPTSIFIPQRLRQILSYQRVTENGVFLENCKSVRMSFHGSLEVISNKGFGTLLDHIDDCQTVLPFKDGTHTHFRYYGEDKFAAWCMHAYGVDKVPSRQQVGTVPKDQHILGLHLTVSCPTHRTVFERKIKKWHPNCSRVRTAGLHAFQTVDEYLTCLKNTTEGE